MVCLLDFMHIIVKLYGTHYFKYDKIKVVFVSILDIGGAPIYPVNLFQIHNDKLEKISKPQHLCTQVILEKFDKLQFMRGIY
jgi:hypothetical protein